jgi:hypothetical protein
MYGNSCILAMLWLYYLWDKGIDVLAAFQESSWDFCRFSGFPPIPFIPRRHFARL